MGALEQARALIQARERQVRKDKEAKRAAKIAEASERRKAKEKEKIEKGQGRSSDPRQFAEDVDMKEVRAKKLMDFAEEAFPFKHQSTVGRKERSKLSCPEWVAYHSKQEFERLRKKRGRPPLTEPYPGFYETFPDEAYAEGTIKNKMTHMRSILRYMDWRGWGDDLGKKGALTAPRWRQWGLEMAAAGVCWTVLSYYLGTVRKFMIWHQYWSRHEIDNIWYDCWQQVKRTAIRYRPSQAPVIQIKVFRALDRETKRIVIFCAALGIRFSSLKSIRTVDIN